MNLSPSQHEARIDAVVREVLARLRRGIAEGRALGEQQRGGGSPHQNASDAAGTAAEQPVHVAGPVISVSSLQSVPPHVRRATIGATAVVTPAARDAARQRGLTLSIASPVGSLHGSATPLLVADADCPQRHATTVNQLQRRAVAVVSVATAALVPRVVSGRAIGVLLSDLPAPHVCNACRNAELRAAAVGSLEEAERIAVAMDVNLWVIDAKRLPLSRILMLLQHIASLASAVHDSATTRATR